MRSVTEAEEEGAVGDGDVEGRRLEGGGKSVLETLDGLKRAEEGLLHLGERIRGGESVLGGRGGRGGEVGEEEGGLVENKTKRKPGYQYRALRWGEGA